MSWDFIVWLVAFVLQAVLLGMIMYGLILLSDLENDFINPHDCSARINQWVAPEYVVQGVMATMLALRFEWLAAPFHVALALYNGRLWMRHAHKTDVTEIFRQLPREKNIRIAKLVFYLVSFIYCIYRCIMALVYWLDALDASGGYVPHIPHAHRAPA